MEKWHKGLELSDERGKDYGHPYDNFTTIAELWTAAMRQRGILKEGARFEYSDVPIMNVLQKIARECHSHKMDNWDDTEGYSVAFKKAREKAAAK